MSEMKTSNKNNLPLSRVVGASSGVPVLFPPTHIFGDTLVDGGVADNQGLEALLEHERSAAQPAGHVLLVSDASGQLEAIHTINSSEEKVFGRVNSILQFQVRAKLLDRLVQWKVDAGQLLRYFGFVHLFLNLKDRGIAARLPSEIIPAVARIRTDLDQFSLVEREALMYHGYTLIDAQINQYCEPLTQAYPQSRALPLAEPPLLSPEALATVKNRDRIRKELEEGAESLFLLRSLKKYPGRVAPVFVAWALVWGASLWLLFAKYTTPLRVTQDWVNGLLRGITSGWIGVALHWVLRGLNAQYRQTWMDIPSLLAVLIGAAVVAGIAGYVLAFPTYWLVRRLAMSADRATYQAITKQPYSVHWKCPEPPGEGRSAVVS
jgi:hypothetical protein